MNWVDLSGAGMPCRKRDGRKNGIPWGITLSGRRLPILLFPETEIVDQLPVPIEVRSPEILEKSATTPDHLEESLPAVVVRFVLLEVSTQMIDALREEGDLHRGTPSVSLVKPVLFDHYLSFLRADVRHSAFICLRKSTYLQGKPSVR
jgi:hypothetical protein